MLLLRSLKGTLQRFNSTTLSSLVFFAADTVAVGIPAAVYRLEAVVVILLTPPPFLIGDSRKSLWCDYP